MGIKMTWPLSKNISCTNDQTEISGTEKTLRKDRKFQQLNRLRCEKLLRDELGKLKTERMLSEKRHAFEKHYYETKLKDFKGRRILSAFEMLRNKSRKDDSLHLLPMGLDIKRKIKNNLVNKLSDSTVLLPRKDLKWCLNDPTEKKATERERLSLNKTREKALNYDKLPTINNQRNFEEVKIRKGEKSTLSTKLDKRTKEKPRELSNAMLPLKGLAKNFPAIIGSDH